MRLLSFWPCMGITATAGVVFLIGSGIAAATKADRPPIYSGQCVLAKVETAKVKATCGEIEKVYSEIDEPIVAALSHTPLTVTCRVYETRGILGTYKLDCADK